MLSGRDPDGSAAEAVTAAEHARPLKPPTSNFPDDWHALLDIPDEAGGLAALNAGADYFSLENASLRTIVLGILAG